jgi:hypothetical protein
MFLESYKFLNSYYTIGRVIFMEEEIKFRKQAEDEYYNEAKKPFLVSLPPRASFTALFFSLLVLALFSSLYFLRVPVKLVAPGTVDTGFEIFTISNYWDDAIVKKIHVKTGDVIDYNQSLFELSRKHDTKLVNSIHSFMEQKTILSERMSRLNAELLRSKIKYKENVKNKMSVVWSIGAQLKMAELREHEIFSQFKKGLTPKDRYVLSQEKTASLKTSLAIEKSNLSSLEDSFENNRFTLLNENNSIQRMLTEVEIKISNNPLSKTVSSPCICTVTNVTAKLDRPTPIGKELIWLQVATKKDIQVTARIPSNKYKPIAKGSRVYITAPAFPSLRFGKLKGVITETAFKHEAGEGQEAYFIIKMSVENVPEGIVLTTGMVIEAEFILDTPRLYEFIVN